jgi:hypothetical protein
LILYLGDARGRWHKSQRYTRLFSSQLERRWHKSQRYMCLGEASATTALEKAAALFRGEEEIIGGVGYAQFLTGVGCIAT